MVLSARGSYYSRHGLRVGDDEVLGYGDHFIIPRLASSPAREDEGHEVLGPNGGQLAKNVARAGAREAIKRDLKRPDDFH